MRFMKLLAFAGCLVLLVLCSRRSQRVEHHLQARSLPEIEVLLSTFPHGDYPKNMTPELRWRDWAQAYALYCLVTGRQPAIEEIVPYRNGTRAELPGPAWWMAEKLLAQDPYSRAEVYLERPWFVSSSIPHFLRNSDWDLESAKVHVRKYLDWMMDSTPSGLDLGELLLAVLLAQRCGFVLEEPYRAAILSVIEQRTLRVGDKIGASSQFGGRLDAGATLDSTLLLASLGVLLPSERKERMPAMSTVSEYDGQIIADEPLYLITGISLLKNYPWLRTPQIIPQELAPPFTLGVTTADAPVPEDWLFSRVGSIDSVILRVTLPHGLTVDCEIEPYTVYSGGLPRLDRLQWALRDPRAPAYTAYRSDAENGQVSIELPPPANRGTIYLSDAPERDEELLNALLPCRIALFQKVWLSRGR